MTVWQNTINRTYVSPEPQPKVNKKTIETKASHSKYQSSLSFQRINESVTSSDDDEQAEDVRELESDETLRQLIFRELTTFRKTECKSFFTFAEFQKAHTLLEETKAVFSWWKCIASKFPNLRIVAAKSFSARISSASAERLFSLAGLVRTARRNRMSANLFDCLIA
jgi:hypothetical protein